MTMAKRLTAAGLALTLAGLGASVYGFTYLHNVEFGPGGYLCPAYACTLDTLFNAGYGWFVALSYGGIVLFAAGVVALGAALFIGRRARV